MTWIRSHPWRSRNWWTANAMLVSLRNLWTFCTTTQTTTHHPTGTKKHSENNLINYNYLGLKLTGFWFDPYSWNFWLVYFCDSNPKYDIFREACGVCVFLWDTTTNYKLLRTFYVFQDWLINQRARLLINMHLNYLNYVYGNICYDICLCLAWILASMVLYKFFDLFCSSATWKYPGARSWPWSWREHGPFLWHITGSRWGEYLWCRWAGIGGFRGRQWWFSHRWRNWWGCKGVWLVSGSPSIKNSLTSILLCWQAVGLNGISLADLTPREPSIALPPVKPSQNHFVYYQ